MGVETLQTKYDRDKTAILVIETIMIVLTAVIGKNLTYLIFKNYL